MALRMEKDYIWPSEDYYSPEYKQFVERLLFRELGVKKEVKLASESQRVKNYLSGSDYNLGDPVYLTKEQPQQENKMDLNVLVKLVDTTYNDDLKTSGKYFDALPEKVVEALKRKIEDEKNCVAEDAAEEILKLIKGYDQEIDRLVGMLREYRKKVDQCKARLKALNEAMEYGNSSSNYLPLAKTMGFNVNGIDPKLLDITPHLDRTTESSTLKE